MSETDFLGYQRAVASGELQSTRDSSVPIQVRLPDEPDTDKWPREGAINFVDNRVDPNSGTIRVRAVLRNRSEEHTSELQSLMRISYAVFCLKKKKLLSKILNKIS